MKLVTQQIGPIALPAIAGHDKTTHAIYGGLLAAAAAGVCYLVKRPELAPGAAFLMGTLAGAGKEAVDYLVRGKRLTSANFTDSLIDFIATAAPGVALAWLLLKL